MRRPGHLVPVGACNFKGFFDASQFKEATAPESAHREVSRLLQQLAPRVGFRLEPGLSERVVFRELFLDGSTLLDLYDDEAEGFGHASHIRARQEIDDLLRAVGACK